MDFYKNFCVDSLNRTLKCYRKKTIELTVAESPDWKKIGILMKEYRSLQQILKEKLESNVVSPLRKGKDHEIHQPDGEIKNVGATIGAHNVRFPERITSARSGTYNVENLERITPNVKYRPYDIEHIGQDDNITNIQCYSKSSVSNEVKLASNKDCESKSIGKTVDYRQDKILKSLHEKLECNKLEHNIEHFKSCGDGI